MSEKPRRKSSRPLSGAERLGRVWGYVFVGIVAILLVTLVGKALLTPKG